MAGVDDQRRILPVRHPGSSRRHLLASADGKRRGACSRFYGRGSGAKLDQSGAPPARPVGPVLDGYFATHLAAICSQCRSWLSRAHERRDDVVYHLRVDVAAYRPFSRRRDAICKSAFESGITAAVSIFTIKLSLFLTNLVTNTGAVYAVVRSPGARLTQHHGIAQLSIRCSCRAGKSRLIRP